MTDRIDLLYVLWHHKESVCVTLDLLQMSILSHMIPSMDTKSDPVFPFESCHSSVFINVIFLFILLPFSPLLEMLFPDLEFRTF